MTPRTRSSSSTRAEAETVRTIFQLYLELRSFGKLVAELDRRKIVTKRRNTKVAKYQGGIPFTYGPLAYFLKNRIYLGEMHHGGKWFKGEHEAILDRETFDQVQQLLKREHRQARHKILGERRPAQGQAVRRQGQPDGTELFEQERRPVPLLRQHRLARTQPQGRLGHADLGTGDRATRRGGSSDANSTL